MFPAFCSTYWPLTEAGKGGGGVIGIAWGSFGFVNIWNGSGAAGAATRGGRTIEATAVQTSPHRPSSNETLVLAVMDQ